MPAKTIRTYCVQQDGHYDWFDVSEWVEHLPTAEAMLARFREDRPDKSFRLAEYVEDRR